MSAPHVERPVTPPIDDPELLADRLEAAVAGGRAPDFSEGDPKAWMLALEVVIERRNMDAAVVAVGYLAAAYPDVAYLATMKPLLDGIPPPPPARSGALATFFNDKTKSVQVVRARRSDTVLFAFCAYNHSLLMPVNMMHRWLARLNVHIVYLNDAEKQIYLHGIPALAPDLDGTVAALRRIAKDLGARRILCLGPSGGGYACLRYGVSLGADRILALSPITTPFMDLGVVPKRLRQRAAENPLPHDMMDLLPLYASAERPPRAHIVFGGDRKLDRSQAEHLAAAPSVSVEPLPGVAVHNIIQPLITSGRLDQLLDWLAERPAPRGVLGRAAALFRRLAGRSEGGAAGHQTGIPA